MKPESSEYVNEQRKEYSLYVLQMRAIPALTDGLKAAARRVLWTGRDGKKYKSATLAGATMPIHPHASPESTIDTLAAHYGNNIPLLEGIGAFGTLLHPTAYGASRYTSVKISSFTKDVMFKDIEIIPMVENYDGTLEEPKHFLPLIPTVLLNPTEGIAVGFACNILPRSLDDIIAAQIQHLGRRTKNIEDVYPCFVPSDSIAHTRLEPNKWIFDGAFHKKNSTTITITKLPYGVLHEKFINNLNKLIDDNTIVDYEDGSSDSISIDVKFKRGVLDTFTKTKMLSLLGLTNVCSENMNVIDLDHLTIWSTDFVSVIKRFTDWRLGWYKKRYERLAQMLAKDIQRYEDVLLAIKKNLGSVARQIHSRTELKELLEGIGIVHIDYVADLPIYRFTNEEKSKVEKKLEEANDLMKIYKQLLASEDERKKVYITELKYILKKYG